MTGGAPSAAGAGGAPAGGPRTGVALALDTATPATIAAVHAADGRRASRFQAPGPGERPGHTRLLLGLAGDALADVDASWDEVTRIVVGLGPGTFTGIRVGVATARALALSTGAGLVGVPTPWALAAAVADASAGGSVLVVQDARRRELFLTAFPDGDARDAAVGDPGAPVPWTVPRDRLADAVAGLAVRPRVAVGDGALAHADALRAAGVEVPEDPAAHEVDGLALLRAASASPVVEPEALRPVYVRDADAVPTADRR